MSKIPAYIEQICIISNLSNWDSIRLYHQRKIMLPPINELTNKLNKLNLFLGEQLRINYMTFIDRFHYYELGQIYKISEEFSCHITGVD